jgi:hypothetical protein
MLRRSMVKPAILIRQCYDKIILLRIQSNPGDEMSILAGFRRRAGNSPAAIARHAAASRA